MCGEDSMKAQLSAGASGLLFGLGLVLSGMVNPAKVLNFLDIAGQWDPSLIFVMMGALATTFVGYRWIKRLKWPMFEHDFHWPTATRIDVQLIAGSGLFGIGWGLAGLCPGPAITAAGIGGLPVLVFLASMLGTIALYRFISSARIGSAQSP